MRLFQQISSHILILIFACMICSQSIAASTNNDLGTIDRIQLVMQQTKLLKSRLAQAKTELASLPSGEQVSQTNVETVTQSVLDKASLEIAVAKSNLDSINIEQADSQQTISWLEKNIQEIENQLNVLNIFGLKNAPNKQVDSDEYRADIAYQKQLLQLEKIRNGYLQSLQTVAENILTQKTERYNRLSALLKSRKLLHMQQQQVKDELAFQEQQNHWLEQLNALSSQLAKIDPKTAQAQYEDVERDIFYANEKANYAYVQSLIARYKDQIEQMKLAVYKSNSITLLNEITNQVQTISKQLTRLDGVLNSRIDVLDKHIDYLAAHKQDNAKSLDLEKLRRLENDYKTSDASLNTLNQSLASFRTLLDSAIQNELSARQGFPTFSTQTLLNLGKEMLLVPALTFQVLRSLSSHFINASVDASVYVWSFFIAIQALFFIAVYYLRKLLKAYVEKQSQWREQINPKWLLLQRLQRNFIDLMLIGNGLAVMKLLDVPAQNLRFVMSIAGVWLTFKVINTISRICLVETTHDTTGHDVRLYHRLKWVILVGGVITAFTVFVHQLPLIYELKSLCNSLFLLMLMFMSLLLLRSYDVVPNLILSHMETQHPYLEKSIRLIGIIIPVLLFSNSIIGLLGFVNLVMTISWYEGIFLVVLIGYLILRGFLSDVMEQASRMMIHYVNNGWLWTEAFLKPLDTVLRITLFLMSWAVLFLLYGWDKQSPIVDRLTKLLHYQLVNFLNTSITPLNIIELCIVISIFYWTAKWTREFMYRLLLSRTKDMGIRNSIAILSQYSVVFLGAFISLRVLGIDLNALTVVAASLAFGIGFGLRDLANNFVSGFLLLIERPLRVGDIVNLSGLEGEVTHIGGRAVTVRTWDHMEMIVPNSEIFNKSFTNWTAKDNIVRSIANIKISRHDNPHEVKVIIQNVLAGHKEILQDPAPEVLLAAMNDNCMEFEIRYHVNIRQVKSRISVMSAVLMNIWDAFAQHGIKPPYPHHQVFIRGDATMLELPEPQSQTQTKSQ